MANDCEFYYMPDTENYLVEYRGNFKEQIDRVDYACGDIINETIGVIALHERNLDRLLRDVPEIIYVDFRATYILQNISPSNVDNINSIKINPYLNLTGRGVLVGIVDTGIDYLNQEFMREDDTSRILSIWDQTIKENTSATEYIGATYSNEQINEAIKAYRNNQDPYAIVPSRDEIGHGTKIASIIGARGYNTDIKGIAHDCEFVIVKLFESSNFKKILRENRTPEVPVYNNSEILAGLEYLRKIFVREKRPMVICICLGSNSGAHDGTALLSRYITFLGTIRGICLVAGVGNEGASQGHASGFLAARGDVKSIPLNIPREIKYLSFYIWVQKPNRASLEVISPDGESSKVIEAKKDKEETYRFVFTNTEMNVKYYDIESFTGHQVIRLRFYNIKTGVWRLNLVGEYIINGRYDIWLPPKSILPENTVFLEPDPFNTLQIPSTATNIVSVSYYGYNNALVAASGKGFNTDGLINPDIATMGINILTTDGMGGVTTFSGSSAATSIVAGCCALLLEWGIIKGNDFSMYSKKIISYLTYGAYRNPLYRFPNRETGYGDLDLLGTFNVISRSYRGLDRNTLHSGEDNQFIEYNINGLYIRIPKNIMGDFT